MEDDKTVTTNAEQPATVNQSISTPPVSNPSEMPLSLQQPAKSTKSKWFLPAILAAVLLLGGGAAAYVTVFQKSPETLWKNSLANTADGIQKYLDTSNTRQDGSFAINGKFKVSSPTAIDGSFESKWKDQKGYVKLDIGAAGTRVNAELRAIPPEGSETPDIYLNVDGLDALSSLAASFAGPDTAQQLADANGQWYVIDHTLLDQYAQSAGADAEKLSITKDEMKVISDKMMVVMRDRLFSTEEDKAVFTIIEKIGKEDFEGTSSYKMRVGVDKENFKNFVVALKDAAKETKLAELLTSGDTSKTLEEALNFDELLGEIDKANFDNKQADVWVEAGGRYVRNVRFYPVDDKKDTNYLDFGLNYKGGDVLPFSIRATVDEDGDKGTAQFGLDVNQSDSSVEFTMNIDMQTAGDPIKAEGNISVVPSSEDVQITAPDSPKSIYELIGGSLQGRIDSMPLEFGEDLPLQIDDVELQ